MNQLMRTVNARSLLMKKLRKSTENGENDFSLLTSLAVTPIVTRDRAKMLKTVTPRLSTDPETDGHGVSLGVTVFSILALNVA